MYEVMEDECSFSLVGYPNVLETKGHDCVAVCSPWGDEPDLFSVVKLYFYLFIPSKIVDKRFDCVACYAVH